MSRRLPTKDDVKPAKMFWTLSTGHCGTAWLAHLLALSKNGLIEHETSPRLHSHHDWMLDWHDRHGDYASLPNCDNLPYLGWYVSDLKLRMQQAPIWGETGNDTWPFALSLYREFGSICRFIHLVREPVGFVQSALSRSQWIWLRPNWLTGNSPPAWIEALTYLWKKVNLCIIKQLSQFPPEMCWLLNFEKLTGPEMPEEIAKLAAWLRLDLHIGKLRGADPNGLSKHYANKRSARNPHFDPARHYVLAEQDKEWIQRGTDHIYKELLSRS